MPSYQKVQFPSQTKRYQSTRLPQDFSDEEMIRDRTLSLADKQEICRYHTNSRLFVAIQLCSIRLYGRFLMKVNELSPRIVNYLSSQAELPPTLTIQIPKREATFSEQRKNILTYLGFSKYNDQIQLELQNWLIKQVGQGSLPDDLYARTEQYLLNSKIILPGSSVIERLIISVCAEVHERMFELLYSQLSPQIKSAIDDMLEVTPESQRSMFYLLKEYPPSASISTIKDYLERYKALVETNIDSLESQIVNPLFMDYLYKLAQQYSIKDIKRFREHKRYSLVLCFLLEAHKILLDHLIKMHDQYITDLLRHGKRLYEKKHREFRKRQKKAVDTMLETTQVILNWPETKPLTKSELWQQISEKNYSNQLVIFKYLRSLKTRAMVIYCWLVTPVCENTLQNSFICRIKPNQEQKIY